MEEASLGLEGLGTEGGAVVTGDGGLLTQIGWRLLDHLITNPERGRTRDGRTH